MGRRSGAEFDVNGRLVNTLCTHCGQYHTTRDGNPACRGHLKYHPDQPCKNGPLAGQSTCGLHGGKTEGAMAGGRKRLALGQVREEMVVLGGMIDVDEVEAVMIMVQEAAWNVAYLRSLVQQISGEVSTSVDLLGVGQAYIASRVKLDDLTVVENIIKKMYDAERDRLVRYSKIAHDMGISERRTKIAEEQGMWLVQTLDMVFTQLNLTPDQAASLPPIMGRIIEELEAGDTGP